MEKQYRSTWVEVDIQNLKHNVKTLRGLLPKNEFFCPMVKANGYGHGDVAVSVGLIEAGVKTVGVAFLEEGIHLRESGIRDLDILVFHPPTGVEFIKACAKYKLTPVLSRMLDFKFFKGIKSKVPVHIKVNTGMARLGFDLTEVNEIPKACATAQLKVEGVCTHLHTCEDFLTSESTARRQLELLVKVNREMNLGNKYLHGMNSGGLIGQSIVRDSYGGRESIGARPGISIYGVVPEFTGINAQQEQFLEKIELKPVLSWFSKILTVHELKPGDSVSYNARWTAKRNSIIGAIPCGYGDGLMRKLSNKGEAIVASKKVPIVGTVCMDFTMVDLTDLGVEAESLIGADVTLIGRAENEILTADSMAKQAETNAYEILTNISRRVPREYV